MKAETSVELGFSNPIGGTVSSPALDESYSLARDLSEDLGSVPWDPVQRWLRKKRPKTQEMYKIYLERFLDRAEALYGFGDARGFLSWAARQKRSTVVVEAVESFAETQRPSTRQVAIASVKTFLEVNGHPPLPSIVAEDASRTFYRGFGREEIIRYLSFLNRPFEKLYVLFSKDAGFRARTTLTLKYHHVKPDLEAGMDFCHLYLEPDYYKGSKAAGISFIGPDSVTPLRELIKQGKVKTNSENCDKRYPEKCKCSRIFPFRYAAINGALNLAKKKAGLDPALQPVHGLRKFFENALDKLDPPLDHIKKMQLEGHSIGVRWHYTDQAVEQLRPLYQQAYQYLTLSEEAVADRKVKALVDQIRALKQENERYKDMDLRLQTIESQLAARVVYTAKR